MYPSVSLPTIIGISFCSITRTLASNEGFLITPPINLPLIISPSSLAFTKSPSKSSTSPKTFLSLSSKIK